jgi:hypothetical protein
MIQINRIGTQYSDNVIDPLLSFNTPQTWNVTSGTGSATISTDSSFEGQTCLKLENTDAKNDLVVTNTAQNTVITASGSYGLSFYLNKKTAVNTVGNVKIFKNGVLLATETIPNFDALNTWLLFTTEDKYNLAKNDIITFTFQMDGDGVTSVKALLIDGLKLFKYSTNQLIPTFYTKPKEESFNDITGFASYTDTNFPDSGSAQTIPANTDTVLRINAGTIYDAEKPKDINSFYYSGGLDIGVLSGSFQLNEVITGGTSGATATLKNVNGLSLDFVNDSIIRFSASETITGAISGATATINTVRNGYLTGRNGDDLSVMLYFKAVPSSASQWIDIWVDIEGSVGELYRETIGFPKGSGIERGVLYALPAAYTRGTFEANGGKIYVRTNASIDIYDIDLNTKRTHRGINS